MTWDFILILLAGAAAGGFINGLAGFGTSLFALVWWLQILPPIQAVALSLVMSVLSGVPGVMVVRQHIQWRRLAVFLVPAILGIPLGLWLLRWIDAGMLKAVVAGFLIVFGGYFSVRRTLPGVPAHTPHIDAGIGFAGGVLGAIAGLSGALPTMWTSLKPWGKAERRAVLQPYNVTILGLAAAMLALAGTYDLTVLGYIALAFPATMLASWVGIRTFHRLSDTQHQRLLIALMLISGLSLAMREALF